MVEYIIYIFRIIDVDRNKNADKCGAEPLISPHTASELRLSFFSKVPTSVSRWIRLNFIYRTRTVAFNAIKRLALHSSKSSCGDDTDDWWNNFAALFLQCLRGLRVKSAWIISLFAHAFVAFCFYSVLCSYFRLNIQTPEQETTAVQGSCVRQMLSTGCFNEFENPSCFILCYYIILCIILYRWMTWIGSFIYFIGCWTHPSLAGWWGGCTVTSMIQLDFLIIKLLSSNK